MKTSKLQKEIDRIVRDTGKGVLDNMDMWFDVDKDEYIQILEQFYSDVYKLSTQGKE